MNTGIGSFHKIQVSGQVLNLADMEELCRVARDHGLPDKSCVTFGLEHETTVHAEVLTSVAQATADAWPESSPAEPTPDPWQEAPA